MLVGCGKEGGLNIPSISPTSPVAAQPIEPKAQSPGLISDPISTTSPTPSSTATPSPTVAASPTPSPTPTPVCTQSGNGTDHTMINTMDVYYPTSITCTDGGWTPTTELNDAYSYCNQFSAGYASCYKTCALGLFSFHNNIVTYYFAFDAMCNGVETQISSLQTNTKYTEILSP